MKDKLPPFPWEFKSMKVVGEESTRIMDCAGYYIAHEDGIRQLEQRDDIASAIVSAVNNTYGAGINPEAVPDLLKACKEAQEWLVYAGHTGGQVNYDALELINNAIEKSKLPTP